MIQIQIPCLISKLTCSLVPSFRQSNLLHSSWSYQNQLSGCRWWFEMTDFDKNSTKNQFRFRRTYSMFVIWYGFSVKGRFINDEICCIYFWCAFIFWCCVIWTWRKMDRKWRVSKTKRNKGNHNHFFNVDMHLLFN